MTDPRDKKTNGQPSGDQDFAALLRASLDRESEKEPESVSREEDELSRLLREQLARFGQDDHAEQAAVPEEITWPDDVDDIDDEENEDEPYIPEGVEDSDDEDELYVPEGAEDSDGEDELDIPEEAEDSDDEDELYVPEGAEDSDGEDELNIPEEAEDSGIEDADIFEPMEEAESSEDSDDPEEASVEATTSVSEEETIDQPETETARPLSEILDEIKQKTDTADNGDYDVNGRFTRDILGDFLASDLDDGTKEALRKLYGDRDDKEDPWAEIQPAEDASNATLADLSDDVTPEEDPSSAESSEVQDLPSEGSPPRSKPPVTKWYDPLQLTLDSVESSKRHALGIAAKDQKEGAPRPRRSSEPTAEAHIDTNTLQGYAVADSSEARDRDTALYLHLGYEEELSHIEETEHITRVSNAYEKEEHIRQGRDGVRNSPPVAYDGEDYDSPEQTCAEERAYEGAGAMSKLRLWMTLIFALVGLGFDVFPDFAPLIGGLEAMADSFAYPLLGLLWLVLGCLPSVTHLWGGLRSLWELKPVAYALPASAQLLTILHTLIACFLSGQGVRLYIGGSLLILFFACLGDCFKTTAEQVSFRVISSGKAKYVLTEEKNGSVAESDDAYIHTFRTRKVERLADYFRQVTRYDRREAVTGHSICMAFLGALVIAATVTVMGKGAWISGLSSFMGVYLAALPSMFLLSLTLPLMLVNRTIGRHGCAVLSPEAAEIYAPGKQVEAESMRLYFTAEQVLKATDIKAVTLSGDGEAGQYRAIANRLFSLLGSPLGDDEYPVRDGDLKGIHVEVAEAEKDALRLYMVDARRNLACEVLMGTYHALQRKGIKLPRGSMEEKWKKTEDSRVLYLAFDRRFRLAYAVRYKPRRSFAGAVGALTPLGYVLSVVSYDPLVTEDLFAPLTTAHQPHMELLRPRQVTEERESRSCSILATGRAVDIAYPLMACRRMKTLSRRMWGLSWLCTVLALVGLGLCLGLNVMTHVSPLILWLWHFLWAGIAWLCVKTGLHPSRLSMTEKKHNK